MSTRIHVVVPDELLGQIDKFRGDVPRSKFVVRALEHFVTPTVTGPNLLPALEKALGDSPAVPGPSRSGGLPASSRTSKKSPSLRDTWAR